MTPTAHQRDIVLVRAPCNLGLRPLREGHEPGAWRAPEALTAAGLIDAVRPSAIVDLPRPAYDPRAQTGTSIRNGLALREFNMRLAEAVERIVGNAGLPLVVGGDCSILLGALAGCRKHGPLSLVHIDGHSDFRHPGNRGATPLPDAAAGMDLALATGRGESLLTDWPGLSAPLVPDRHVVQVGERDSSIWPDVDATAITRIGAVEVEALGAQATLDKVWATLDTVPARPFWLHLDVDVLDQTIMPAVDSPGSPGMDLSTLSTLLGNLFPAGRCRGMTLTIFDPDLDIDGRCAHALVELLHDFLTTAR